MNEDLLITIELKKNILIGLATLGAFFLSCSKKIHFIAGQEYSACGDSCAQMFGLCHWSLAITHLSTPDKCTYSVRYISVFHVHMDNSKDIYISLSGIHGNMLTAKFIKIFQWLAGLKNV